MTTQNAQVISYISLHLYDCLEQLKNERGFNSVSQAVNVILEDYFRANPCPSVSSPSLPQLEKDLKTEVANLKKQVSQLQQAAFTSNQTGQLTKLSQKQLAERLGIDSSIVEQHKTDGKEFTEWSKSQDPNRIAWEYTGANLFRPV